MKNVHNPSLSNWLGPTLVVLMVAGAYLVMTLLRNGGDPFTFIRLGTRFDPGVPNGSMGYDGQFDYQIALDPLGSPSKLDVPAYRLQRILYPLLARLVALGRPSLIPWALVAVNLAALAAGTAATEALLVHHHQSRWWALAFGLNVGMLMSVRLDLNEPTAFALVQLAALAWAKGRRASSAVAFALAALAKEVTLIIALGYILGAWQSESGKSALKWAAAIVLPFAAWQGMLLVWVGRIGIGSGGALASGFQLLPFQAWWSLASYDLTSFLKATLLLTPLVLVPVIAALAIAIRALSKGFARATTLALLVQAAAFMFLPQSNLVDPLGISRFSIGLIACLIAFGAERGNRRVLAYTQLWILTLAFAVGDNFLPGA